MEPFDPQPIGGSDIIDRLVRLIRLRFRHLLVVGLAVLVPASFAIWWLYRSLFANVIGLVEAASGVPNDMSVTLDLLLGTLGLSGALLLVYLAAWMAVFTANQIVVCGATMGRDISAGEALRLTFGPRLVRALAQRLLAEAAAMSMIVIPYTLMVTMAAARSGASMVVLGLLAFLIGFGFMIYLRVRWAFGTTTIAWEDAGIIDSFRRSWRLTERHTLRTTGILAVAFIIVYFGVQAISIPIQYVVMIDLWDDYLAIIRESMRGGEPNVVPFLRGMASIGPLLALSTLVAMLVEVSLKSVLIPTLYFDLRARHGEFNG